MTTIYKSGFGAQGSGDGQFGNSAFGISIYNNEMYITDGTNCRVQVFNLSGVYQRQWGSGGSGNGEFNVPYGIFVYEDEVYVTDNLNNRVQVFNLSGVYQRQWGSGSLITPVGIFVYEDEVYVADAGNSRIQVYNLSGVYQRTIGTPGGGDGQLGDPQNIFIHNDELYVIDYLNYRVQVFNLSGVYQRQWGSYGNENGQFVSPMGIFIVDFAWEEYDEVYISDNDPSSEYMRVQVFDLNGVYKRKWTTVSPIFNIFINVNDIYLATSNYFSNIAVQVFESISSIDYFGSSSNPLDNEFLGGPIVEVPPLDEMWPGDLVILIACYRVSEGAPDTLEIAEDGGQSWNAEDYFVSTPSIYCRLFWCRFNGTWDANPSVTAGSSTSTMSVVMHVFRPTSEDSNWQIDVPQVVGEFSAPSYPYDVTI